MPNSIEEIARGLTEAQRRALVGKHIEIGGFTVLQPTFNEPRTRGATMDALRVRGLVVGASRFGRTALTPLGLALRTHLQSRQP